MILYEKNEITFNSLGLGSLLDATSCTVKEQLNGDYELVMEYPITGHAYNLLELRRIILAKPNDYMREQPFRIYEITKPIDGLVTVRAEHISYDISGIPVIAFSKDDKGNPLPFKGVVDAISKIQNGALLESPFRLSTDKTDDTEMTIAQPYNMRTLLMGTSGSILEVYGGEFKFDRFDISLLNNRGYDKGFTIRYSKNMTDLTVRVNTDRLYTAVFPYYYKEVTLTESTTKKVFQQVYIRENTEPLSRDWLSPEEDGQSISPLLSHISVQIAKDGKYSGEYAERKYAWDGTTNTFYETPDAEPNLYSSETETVTQYNYVELPEKFIYIDEQATDQKILTLNMASIISDTPAESFLREKAEEYIRENKIGSAEPEVEVSFIDLYSATDDEILKSLSRVQLGDTVHVIYETLNVDVTLQVIETNYNVLNNQYESIRLGDKSKSISDTALTRGDSVSSLTNDVDYADTTTVNNLIAKQVTADFINALELRVTDANIEGVLSASKISCSGVIEAAVFKVDQVVSDLLKVETAEISKTLTAGEITVRGTIYAESGEIGGCTIQNGVLEVSKIVCDQIVNDETDAIRDIAANVIDAYEINADHITTGVLTADRIDISGVLEAGEAEIRSITAEVIQTSQINADNITTGKLSADRIDADLLTVADLISGTLTVNGEINATSGNIGGCEIVDGKLWITTSIEIAGGIFSVDESGNLYASSAEISGKITAESGSIADFTIDENSIYCGTPGQYGSVIVSSGTDATIDIAGSGSISGWVFAAGKNFGVTDDGDLYANGAHFQDTYINGSCTITSGEFAGNIINVESNNDKSNQSYIWSLQVDKLYIEDTLTIENGVNITGDFVANDAIVNGSMDVESLSISGVEFASTEVSNKTTRYFSVVKGNMLTPSGTGAGTPIIFTFNVYSYSDSSHNTRANVPEDITIPVTIYYRYQPPYGGWSSNTIRSSVTISANKDNAGGAASTTRPQAGSSYEYSSSDTSKTSAEFNIGGSSATAISIDSSFVPSYSEYYNLGSGDSLWDNVFSANGVITTSDKNKKNSISYDISMYDKIFDKLKPVSYKMNHGNSGRTHIGLISQDVKEAIVSSGLTTLDYALYIENKESNYYGLRYSELHGLEIYEIQKLQQKIKLLEKQMEELLK